MRQVGLVRLLRVQFHARAAVPGDLHGRRRPGRRGLEVAEQLLHVRSHVAVDPAAEPDDRALGLVPAVDVVGEGVARGGAHRLLAADDVPAERLVAVQERVVHPADVVARRVEVHVHLLDDHALLAVDLLRLELGVAEHVDEHVEREPPVLGRAAHVVPRVLLAGERVELAADAVDLAADVTRGRAPLGALEEHVLGEVRDPVRLGCLEPGAGREHHEARHGLRGRDRRRQQPGPVGKRLALEGAHQTVTSLASSHSRHWAGISTLSPLV